MRSLFILVPLVCYFALFTYAQQRIVHSDPKSPAEGPRPDHPVKGPQPVPNNPPAHGQKPYAAPEAGEIHFDDIAESLQQLIMKIVKAADKPAHSSTTTTATITQGPLPARATPCISALKAYSSCSKAYSGTFSAVTATVQAGCLCKMDFDFNGEMESCYSYAQSQTQYRSYASVIANATAACSDVPSTSLTNDNAGGRTTTNSSATTSSTATAMSTSFSQTGSTTGVSPSPGGAARSLSVCLGAVVVAAALAFMSILY